MQSNLFATGIGAPEGAICLPEGSMYVTEMSASTLCITKTFVAPLQSSSPFGLLAKVAAPLLLALSAPLWDLTPSGYATFLTRNMTSTHRMKLERNGKSLRKTR